MHFFIGVITLDNWHTLRKLIFNGISSDGMFKISINQRAQFVLGGEGQRLLGYPVHYQITTTRPSVRR